MTNQNEFTAQNLEQISFSTNWNNKLNCQAFTTLRIRNDRKYTVGNHYELYLQKKFLALGFCVAIKHFTIDKLNDFIAYIDTGYDKQEVIEILRKMYPNINIYQKEFSLILLKKIK
jgi:hypothetical protein